MSEKIYTRIEVIEKTLNLTLLQGDLITRTVQILSESLSEENFNKFKEAISKDNKYGELLKELTESLKEIEK